VAWGSYVAIGDSFTEGLDDPDTETGMYRGFADLVAMRLAEEVPDFEYANLAVRGRLFDNIVDEQVPAALRMHPDLISFAAGGNDALRRGFEVSRLIGRLDTAIKTLRASGADVVVFRFADVSERLPAKRVILPRIKALNGAISEIAERRGAMVVDLFADRAYDTPALWSVDRLHMNAIGHKRTAAHVLSTLGVKCDPAWMDDPPHLEPVTWRQARAADLQWTQEHLVPWIKRRMAGKSSGDAITAKRPLLSPVRVDQG
jgi:lysophospholipase L1-like esterase